MPGNENLTPLYILQFSVVALTISAVVFRPGEWTGARWVGLAIAVSAAVPFFQAGWQLGKSFSVTPFVSHGVYSMINNPIYGFSGLTLLGILITLRSRSALLLLAIVTRCRSFAPNRDEGGGA